MRVARFYVSCPARLPPTSHPPPARLLPPPPPASCSSSSARTQLQALDRSGPRRTSTGPLRTSTTKNLRRYTWWNARKNVGIDARLHVRKNDRIYATKNVRIDRPYTLQDGISETMSEQWDHSKKVIVFVRMVDVGKHLSDYGRYSFKDTNLRIKHGKEFRFRNSDLLPSQIVCNFVWHPNVFPSRTITQQKLWKQPRRSRLDSAGLSMVQNPSPHHLHTSTACHRPMAQESRTA